MRQTAVHPSFRLDEVRYEIRGALTRHARALEAAGHAVLKLNIGNPGRFGFRAPAHLMAAITEHLADSDAYGHEQGWNPRAKRSWRNSKNVAQTSRTSSASSSAMASAN